MQNSIKHESASNIVTKDQLRDVQLDTLSKLSKVLEKTYGPNGSNTLILRGSDKASLVAEYSKDGNKVLKAVTFSDPIEMSIQSQIVDVTDFTDKSVGDGTTSATLLSNAIFYRLCELEQKSKYTPYELIDKFKKAVSNIQEKILERKHETTLDDIYDICMISTNGNKTISSAIKNIYEENGMSVYIDTAISNIESDVIRSFDGLTLDEGYSDPAYINTKDGKCTLKNPKIYAFMDPIDTVEMSSFLNKIIIDNIIDKAQRKEDFVPTIIISPKISRDVAAIIENLVDFLYSFNGNITTKPPILIVTNLLGGNMDKYYDIIKLCGCKPIRKYIDPKLQEQDIEKGVAPTPDTIHSFAGEAELVTADSSDTKFINPGDMFEKDDNGFFKVDEKGNFIKSVTYKNMLHFVEDALHNAENNSEDAYTVGNIRKRLQSLQANYVEYMVGGITIADRDSSRDLVQDAVRNCRSAASDGFGCAANYEGYYAVCSLIEDGDSDLSDIYCTIRDAYYDIISILYSSIETDEDVVNDLIITSIENGFPYNLSTRSWDNKVITSIQTDIKILDAISKIVTIMFTANQCLVQAPQINVYQ